MGDMLSQAEINALLGGDPLVSHDSNQEKGKEDSTESSKKESSEKKDSGEVSDEKASDEKASDEKASDEKASEIEAPEIVPEIEVPEIEVPEIEITGKKTEITDGKAENDDHGENRSVHLTDEQKDILGEIGNISMGTSATTLYSLLNEKVLITTPHVRIVKWSELSKDYERPCVGIRVDYSEGVEGSNILILKQRDVKIISNLMLGIPGEEDADGELTEIDLSAIAEAMNQMVGSSSTSLSSLVKMRIDIDTPRAFVLDFKSNNFNENINFSNEDVVCVSFRMVIGTLIDSIIMQVLPMKFAKEMVDIMKNDIGILKESLESKDEAVREEPSQQQPVPVPEANKQPSNNNNNNVQPQANIPSGMQYTPPQQPRPQPDINVQSAQFQNFDFASVVQQKENIGIIMDVPLEVTVELGRASKKIREILEFAPGTIIELDKLAGDPIDILANGKFVAKGEVVVIDENFGIRITDIINVEQRI